MAEAHQEEVHPVDQLAEVLHPQAEGAEVEALADQEDETAAPVRIQAAEEAGLNLIVDIAKKHGVQLCTAMLFCCDFLVDFGK
jgi:hypothetical protein